MSEEATDRARTAPWHSALRLLAGAAVSLLCLPACDNPACVFASNGCNGAGGGGSLGSNAASIPADGEWISPTAPSVVAALPADNVIAGSHTPIVLVFSESMSPEAGTTSIPPAPSGPPPPAGLESAFQLSTTNGAPSEVMRRWIWRATATKSSAPPITSG